MAVSPLLPDQYVPPRVAADFLGRSAFALKYMRLNGQGPRYIRTSPRKISYRVGDLIEWMNSHRLETDESAAR